MAELYNQLIWIYGAATLLTVLSVAIVTAPYGRHSRDGWGPKVPTTAGWMVMEAVSLVGMPLTLFWAAGQPTGAALFMAGAWVIHYANRTLIYPLRHPSRHATMPALIPLMAIAFNTLNSLSNGLGLALAPPTFGIEMAIGATVFMMGMALNTHSDAILRQLRRERGAGYHLPDRGAHRWVAAPNYLGEILEWVGFAIAAQTAAGWLFAAYTIANLAPRARAHLQWYRTRFDDYPPERKALIPHVW